MGAGVEIPFHEAIVFYLGNTSTDHLLKQDTAGIFFIGEQLVDCFSVPLCFAGWRRYTLPLQPNGYFSKAVARSILLKDP